LDEIAEEWEQQDEPPDLTQAERKALEAEIAELRVFL
jgi:hypothetical protein